MTHLDNYFHYAQVEMNFSEYTLKKYRYVLMDLNAYSRILDVPIEQLTYEQLKQYMLQLIAKKYSKATQAQTISIIKSYYKYLLIEGIITINPASNLVYPKRDLKLPNILYESELFALFDSIDTEQKYGKRNLAILTVLYSSGMRISELENLKLNQFKSFQKTITVIGKGNKERIVPLNSYTYEVVEDYILLERDSLLKNNQCEYLFINNQASKLSARGIRYIIDKVVERSALLVKVSPHTLRHSFASHLLNAGMDIRMVQELLGHESLATTEVYTHLDDKALSDKYNKLNIRR